jgi:hypothetical protein
VKSWRMTRTRSSLWSKLLPELRGLFQLPAFDKSYCGLTGPRGLGSRTDRALQVFVQTEAIIFN